MLQQELKIFLAGVNSAYASLAVYYWAAIKMDGDIVLCATLCADLLFFKKLPSSPPAYSTAECK